MKLSSAVVLLVLVVDPIGNMPLFVSLLRRVDARQRTRVILRECAAAFVVLIACVFVGERLLRLLNLSSAALTIAGGLVLFLIALGMIFRNPSDVFGQLPEGEPFIVPIAVPLIAGPSAIATVLLFTSSAPERWPEWSVAVTIAMGLTLMALLAADRIVALVGNRVLAAFERLVGLLLTAVATEMVLRGIATFVRQIDRLP
ncbi:MAG: MarC family protein [Betaproteobacteria bacterium]